MLGARPTGLALLHAALACSASACSAGAAATTPAGSVLQLGFETTVPAMRRVVVLVVDDEATAGAAAIRAATTAALRSTLEKEFLVGLPGFWTDWLRADLRVVVVHPSMRGPGAIAGPDDDPELALVSDDASLAGVDAVADAAVRAVGGATAPADATYAHIDATMRILYLVTHARAPVDAHEAALLDSLGTPELVDLLVATSRDDGAAGAVDGALWRGRPSPSIDRVVVASPLAGRPDGCPDKLDSATRFGQWIAGMRGAFAVDTIDPSCPQDAAAIQTSGLLDWTFADGYPLCLPSPPLQRPGGGAACRIDVTLPDEAPCATYPGMFDPTAVAGTPPWRGVATDAGGSGRVCEVQGLRSPQAEKCSASAPCPDCAPGWCVTVPVSPSCPFGTFRFVHGAVPRGRGLFHIACDLAE